MASGDADSSASAGAVFCLAGTGGDGASAGGVGVSAGLLSSRGGGAGAGLAGGGGGRGGDGVALGAAVTGASLAVRTNGAFAGGAGASPWERPNKASACNAIEASRPQSKARSCRSGWMSPTVAADADMG